MALDFQRGSFMYCASAVGLDSNLFPAQATCVLTTLGGSSQMEPTGYRNTEMALSVEALNASCMGTRMRTPGAYETVVESKINRLSVGAGFKLESGVINLTSTYLRGQHTLTLGLPSEIRFEFGGYAAVATFSTELLAFRNKGTMVEALSDSGFQRDHAAKFYKPSSTPIVVRDGMRCLWEANGLLIYSPVEQIKWDGEGKDGNIVKGHVLISPKVGKLYLAETFRSDNNLRSNLFRLQLYKGAYFAAKGDVAKARVGQTAALIEDEQDGGAVVVGGGVYANGVSIPP